MSSCCWCRRSGSDKKKRMECAQKFGTLSDNSDWMGNLPVSLQNQPINNLSIPGSHDSCSYYLDKSGPIAQDTPTAIKDLGKVFGGFIKELIYKWSQCQSLDISAQLKAGVRYFDIRTALRTDNNTLCICHGLFGPEIEEILAQFLYFLESHPKEIVFLDLNHFYDVSDDRHNDLIEMINQYLGHKLCPFQSAKDLTLSSMWKNEWQVMVFYHNDVARSHPELWPGGAMQSPWPDQVSVQSLIRDLENEYEGQRPEVTDCYFVFQGVLTPDTPYVLQHITQSLKACLCDKVSPPLVEWLQKKTAGPKGISICIQDYVEEADYINTVIGLNKKYAGTLE